MLSSRGWDTCCSINKRAATVSDSIWYRNLWRTRETVQTQVLSSLYLFASTRSNCGHKLQTSVESETGGERERCTQASLWVWHIDKHCSAHRSRFTGHAVFTCGGYAGQPACMPQHWLFVGRNEMITHDYDTNAGKWTCIYTTRTHSFVHSRMKHIDGSHLHPSPACSHLFTTTLDTRYHSLNAAPAADTAASHEVHERA